MPFASFLEWIKVFFRIDAFTFLSGEDVEVDAKVSKVFLLRPFLTICKKTLHSLSHV
jgi:hypothetical protein